MPSRLNHELSVWQSAARVDNVRPNFLPESLMIQGALKRRIKWLLLAIILLIDQAAFAQEMGLRAVYNALSGVMAPIWVAQDAGLFVKHGYWSPRNGIGHREGETVRHRYGGCA